MSLHAIVSVIGVVGDAQPTPSLHAPDGVLSAPVALAMWAVTAVVLAVAVRRTNRTIDDRAIPLMGVMAAFIFAAQLFNFQVIGGTSGHLLGGVLAAVLLGPWAGTLVMACVVAVQGLLFQGFLESARDALFTILPDYTVPAIDDPVVSTVVAGLIGVAIVFLVTDGLGRLLKRRRES